MKKLYSCNARICDDFSLISYHTMVVKFAKQDNSGWDRVWIYRASMTTMQHIRKYCKWLEENGYYDRAYTLKYAYANSVSAGSYRFKFAYNRLTGEIVYSDRNYPDFD